SRRPDRPGDDPRGGRAGDRVRGVEPLPGAGRRAPAPALRGDEDRLRAAARRAPARAARDRCATRGGGGRVRPPARGPLDLLRRRHVSDDPRGRKIAVVADSRLEALLPELQAGGFGTIQLPPAGLPPTVV